MEAGNEINCIGKEGIAYILPQKILLSKQSEDVTFSFRASTRMEQVEVILSDRGKELKRFYKPVLLPAEMERFVLSKAVCSQLSNESELWLEVK